MLSGAPASTPVADVAAAPGEPLRALVEALAEHDHGLIMCMGKGGVGKTTVASALALALASRGKDVLLTTTDPAAHLDPSLATGTLTIARIDPEACVERYRERILNVKGRHLDDAGRAQLEEDLRSPCTEEIAVFEEFSQAVSQARRRVVVMDTAPTGHTLLLMDATGSYHRDIARKMGERDGYTTPLMRLQDPSHTRIVVVTLPETTPVLEASGLQDDLRRARIEPWAWVVNQSLAAAAPHDPLLQARARDEATPLATVQNLAQDRLAVIPLLGDEPTGADALLALTR
ncbi:ribosomal protein L13 [Platysternon megacephalum]|uniref:Ribosomal protein L13 n=1 Tax=Platysternon megacephalum TaxID=55544 RepID=A0A4D9DII3_9SAUR|nr:ribosomal protein L13 [Platysternon megacephalum]